MEDPLVGTLVADRYRVGEKLGEGGMGTVYRAVHEALHKTVALKVLGTIARTQREAIARFEREAVAAANLKHPNIAEATDFGQLPDGGLYLVMEYVEGTTLRKLLEEHGKLPPQRALAILEQVGAALTAAHAREVVHRDLKPENVIVTGANDAVKVIDFGIAKVRSAAFGALPTGLTTVGSVFGTAEYMSPEQVMGQAVDARADQYALGVLAFETLTGKPPFKNDDVSQLMMMHVGAPVPSSREQTAELSAETDAVVAKMMGKLPDERFASVEEAMRALGAAIRAPVEVIAEAPPPPPPPAPPPMVIMPSFDTTMPSPVVAPAPGPSHARTKIAVAIGAGAVLLLLGVVALVLLLRSSPAEVPSPPAVTQAVEESPGPTSATTATATATATANNVSPNTNAAKGKGHDKGKGGHGKH